MNSYLILANQTLAGHALATKVQQLLAGGACRFHIVVPATRQQEGLTWTAGAARAMARRRLENAISSFAELGAVATGDVADESPILAVLDVLRLQRFDEVVLCTLPPGPSRWLRQDLPRRLRRRIRIPVTHVMDERRGIDLRQPQLAPAEVAAAVDLAVS